MGRSPRAHVMWLPPRLASAVRWGRHLVELFQAHEREECHMEDEPYGCRNRRGDDEDEAARVEEGLVTPQGESNLLREKGSDRVVCRGGEGNVM